MNKVTLDYAEAYNDFWSRSDREGSDSYESIEDLVDQILSTVGYGRILDVGCGEGRLVRALVEKGVDAYGIDVSSVAVDRANQFCPERFQCQSVLSLPFSDGYFDTVVSTDCLEHIHPDDVPAAIRELRRVCSSYAYFTIATTIDRDGHWHLTVKPREWWEERFFEAGFIRHPDYYRLNSLEQIESDPWQVTIPLLLLHSTPDTFAPPLQYLRQASDDADLTLSCYSEVAEIVRPGQVVFHVGATSLDLSLILGFRSKAKTVVAFLDTSEESHLQWSVLGESVSVRPLSDLSRQLALHSGTVGLVISGTCHLKEIGTALWKDALTPGARILVISEVAHEGASSVVVQDDYDYYMKEMKKTFNYKGRSISYVALLAPFFDGIKSFIPHINGYTAPPELLIDFTKDYLNPWLPQNLVIPGLRTSSKEILKSEATLILQDPAYRDTADYGSALCVQGYMLLEREATHEEVAAFVLSIRTFIEDAVPTKRTSHRFRWNVSLHYLTALFHLKTGDLKSATASFYEIVSLDVMDFSPTLMTKVISSYLYIGDIASSRKQFDEAATAYERGALAGFGALRAPPVEWVGRWELPIKGAMYEATQIADMINTCLLKLRSIRTTPPAFDPTPKIFESSKESLLWINRKRYGIIQKQGVRITQLTSALAGQASLLEERWAIMQSMEGMIRDRDAALSAQAKMLEARWSIMTTMEDRIHQLEAGTRNAPGVANDISSSAASFRSIITRSTALFRRGIARLLRRGE